VRDGQLAMRRIVEVGLSRQRLEELAPLRIGKTCAAGRRAARLWGGLSCLVCGCSRSQLPFG
jgi:hypothetical protein